MKYMIMECHKGYAVALDEEGRFLRVANMHYEIGQDVSEVTAFREQKTVGMRQRLIMYASLVACLLCIVIASFQLFVLSYGKVNLKINPEVNISVNRLCYVTKLEGKNKDGLALIEGYSFRGKKVEQVLNELTEKAMDDGYLTEGGTVNIGVDSDHLSWKKKHLDGLANELEERFEYKIHIKTNVITEDGNTTQKQEMLEQDGNNHGGNNIKQPYRKENDDKEDMEDDKDDDMDDDGVDEEDDVYEDDMNADDGSGEEDDIYGDDDNDDNDDTDDTGGEDDEEEDEREEDDEAEAYEVEDEEED